jgi:hypothetical protein
MELALIPQPQKMRLAGGFFKVPSSGIIGISDDSLRSAAGNVKAVFPGFRVGRPSEKTHAAFSISLRHGAGEGRYGLEITGKGIRLDAESAEAAFHGIQTLLQVMSQSPAGRLPLLRIDDWPDFADRGVYYDVSRGRVPRLERLLEQADILSSCKINQLQLYIEHTFRFRRHPEIGKGASPLTAEDIATLDAHCRERHVELVPSLASFGHLSKVLCHKKYRCLAEDWGVGKYLSPDADKIPSWQKEAGWTLSPANPGTYEFLDSLFSEFLPLFSSKRFNVCCDETWDLGLGQSHGLCGREGKGNVYLGHIIKLRDIAAKYGKRIMFWGDIIRNYPELIGKIPQDVTVLDWGYAHNHNFNAIRDFKGAGLPFYACPGTSSWVSLFPRIFEAMANIRGFASAGKRNGARGLLNTDWGDGGHYNFMEYSWHGYLFGAEQAWNTGADAGTFTKRFARLFIGTGRKDFVNAIEKLGEITHLSVPGRYQSAWLHIFFAPAGSEVFKPAERDAWVCRKGRIFRETVALDAAFGMKTAKELEAVRKVFASVAAGRNRGGDGGADPHGWLAYWIFAVDTLAHAAKKLTVLGGGGNDNPAARRKLKREMASLMNRFEKLWLARNRPSEIGITIGRYRNAVGSLG